MTQCEQRRHNGESSEEEPTMRDEGVEDGSDAARPRHQLHLTTVLGSGWLGLLAHLFSRVPLSRCRHTPSHRGLKLGGRN